MSADPHHFYTLDEYFALEHTGDARYEYWDGEIICMSGGTKEHTQIGGNCYFLLRLALRGQCQAFTAEQAIKTPALPPYRYPDASAVCGSPVFEQIRGIDTLTNPTLIVEVFSPSSESRDKGSKFEIYKERESLKEYILISQDKPKVFQFVKQSNGSWLQTSFESLDDTLPLASVQSSLKLSDIYENIVFKQ